MEEQQDPRGTGPGEGTPPGGAGGLTPAMRRVLWSVGTVVLAGLAVTIWLLATAGPGAGSADPGSGAGSGATPSATATRGPVPGATPTAGSEVQTPDPVAPPSDRLPPRPTPTPLVSEPLPASGSATGELVAGFPDDVMGPAPDSDVRESSISTEGATMQVTLVARTGGSADDIRAHYRALWTDLGLTEGGGSANSDLTFSDTFTSVSLAFSPSSGTGTVYMIYGVFRAS